jgi:hypothetical protein
MILLKSLENDMMNSVTEVWLVSSSIEASLVFSIVLGAANGRSVQWISRDGTDTIRNTQNEANYAIDRVNSKELIDLIRHHNGRRGETLQTQQRLATALSR